MIIDSNYRCAPCHTHMLTRLASSYIQGWLSWKACPQRSLSVSSKLRCCVILIHQWWANLTQPDNTLRSTSLREFLESTNRRGKTFPGCGWHCPVLELGRNKRRKEKAIRILASYFLAHCDVSSRAVDTARLSRSTELISPPFFVYVGISPQ